MPTALAAAAVLAAGRPRRARSALGRQFFAVAAGYLALQRLYSGPLKHIVIIDVLTIAIGFVLRAVAGAVAIDVAISHWLLVCTILLALFLALASAATSSCCWPTARAGTGGSWSEYSPYLLDQMIGVVTASTLMAYIFYTISPETAEKFGTSCWV